MESMELKNAVKQAIAREQESREIYLKASAMVSQSDAQQMLADLADQELGHKHRLEKLLAGSLETAVAHAAKRTVVDLKIAEYLAPAKLDKDADLQQILVVAMQKEKDSNQFYNAMAQISSGAAAELFHLLASEELVHKNKIETLYDETIYNEN